MMLSAFAACVHSGVHEALDSSCLRSYCKQVLKSLVVITVFYFQYVRESQMNDELVDSDQPLATSEMDEPDLPLDEDGKPLGMFAGPCEFCHQTILPLPTLEMQQVQVCLFSWLCVCLVSCLSVYLFSHLQSVCMSVFLFVCFVFLLVNLLSSLSASFCHTLLLPGVL